MNDLQFRIKDHMNKLFKNQILEKNSHPKRIALFLAHAGLGDHIGMIGAVRYLSRDYDEFYVICKPSNLYTLTQFYSDNPKIRLIIPPVFTTRYVYIVYPTDTVQGEVMQIPHGVYTTVFRSGFFTLPYNSMDDLPSCFYKDLGLDPSIRHSYFHIPDSNDSLELYSLIKDIPYIFVQTKSSYTITPIITWDINKTLTIDPNINQYTSNHPWFTLAEIFVNKPFFHYIETIKHASEIHTVDSSFYCLACYIKTDATVKLCYNRSTGKVNTHYDFT
jgi:hypothetical protein